MKSNVYFEVNKLISFAIYRLRTKNINNNLSL